MLRALAFGLYALTLTLATPLAAELSGLTRQAPTPPAATAFTTFTDAPGDLSDYAGQVVVLNFWATWCAPCRHEMPSLQGLQDVLGEDGLSVVTIAMGRHKKAAMERFWQEAGIDTLPLHMDPEGALARGFGVTGLPHTVILGRDGQILAQLRGPAEWDGPDAIAAMRTFLEP
ncbi:MAG: TlpA disulfide reductase family protein [Pseudomonadota bacterium]